MYVLLKTHKFRVSETSSSEDVIDTCEVRPIVSCCNGPSEKLAWLVTYILTPLLQHVPSYLSDIHQHLENLSTVSPEEIARLNFCSGDISSLFTNINIQASIVVEICDINDTNTFNNEPTETLKLLESISCIMETCKPYSIREFNKLRTEPISKPSTFSCHLLNIDGNASNFDLFTGTVPQFKHIFDVIGIAETNTDRGCKDLYLLNVIVPYISIEYPIRERAVEWDHISMRSTFTKN